MSKPTKIDANTWHYRGFTIVRCTHSRTYIITEPERRPGSHWRLGAAKDEIDFIHYRRDQVASEVPVALEADPDPDAVENVTLTVSLNQARTILAVLNRRCDELDYSPRPPQVDALIAEARATYQSIDRQVFQGATR